MAVLMRRYKVTDVARVVCGRSVGEWITLVDEVLFKSGRYRSFDYSASSLAEDLGLGKSSLSRVLHGSFGVAYNDLVNSHRIKDAERLLDDAKYADMSVDDIGVKVGFRNRQSFFSAFKKYTGVTPQQYRKKNQ